MKRRVLEIVFACGLIVALVIGARLAYADEPPIQMPTSSNGQWYPALRPGTTSAIQYATSTVSPNAAIEAWAVRLVCTTDCLVEIGSDPTATVSSVFLSAEEPAIFRVISGTDTVGAIQHASETPGVIYITPLK